MILIPNIYTLAVLKTIFNLFLGSPFPGGSRGKVRAAGILRRSGVWSDSGGDPGRSISAPSTARTSACMLQGHEESKDDPSQWVPTEPG